ncbi:MAG: hypothetical protein GXO64_01080 [Candidatus Micrarchaeota archaeon]|nr:hypothetical protein [Candidatus Micrarchaeota archaeon]
MKRNVIVMTFVFLVAISMFAAQPVFADEARISINYLGQSPDPVSPGDYVELRWKVDNQAGKSDEYVFELDYSYPFSLDPSETAQKSLGSLTGYQALTDGAIIYWKVRVADDAVEGDSNTVKIKYWKKGDPQAIVTTSAEVVRIQSRQGLTDIDEVILEPQEVEIGKAFSMKIKIDNKGTGFIENVKVKVDTTNTDFMPVDMTNQKIIKRIQGQSSAYVSFKFFVDADASIDVHQIPIELTYYDKFGNSYSDSTVAGIPVIAKPLYLANLESTDIVTAESKGKVVVSVSNVGKGTLYFVVLEIVPTGDYEVIGPTKTYLGNLDSDDFETGQFTIYMNPTEKRTVPLVFRIYYRDAYDKLYNETFSIQHKLYTKEEAAKMGLVSSDNGATVNGIIAVVVIVGLFVWWRRKKRRHK